METNDWMDRVMDICIMHLIWAESYADRMTEDTDFWYDSVPKDMDRNFDMIVRVLEKAEAM